VDNDLIDLLVSQDPLVPRDSLVPRDPLVPGDSRVSQHFSRAYRLIGISSLFHGYLPWSMTATVALRELYRTWHMSWRGFRDGIEKLDERGLLDLKVHPGVASRLTMTPGWLIHKKDDDQHYTALSSAAICALREEHGLSPSEIGMCIRLAVERSSEFASLSAVTSFLGVGYARGRSFVRKLCTAGLASRTEVRGHRHAVAITLDGLMFQAPHDISRRERRQAKRQAASSRARDPRADEAARLLIAHFQELTDADLAPLRSACAGLVAEGWGAREIVAHITGIGELTNARHPLAVVLGRIAAATEELRVRKASANRSTTMPGTDEMDTENDSILQSWDRWLGATMSDDEISQLTEHGSRRWAVWSLIAGHASLGPAPDRLHDGSPIPKNTPLLSTRVT